MNRGNVTVIALICLILVSTGRDRPAPAARRVDQGGATRRASDRSGLIGFAA